MNQFPAWKNLLILGVILLGGLFALPNAFPVDPTVLVALRSGDAVEDGFALRAEQILDNAGIGYLSARTEDGRLMLSLESDDAQRSAQQALADALGSDYTVALTLSSRAPAWLASVGLRPMSLGLDLRGGVHFLFQVDVEQAVVDAMERTRGDFRSMLRTERVPSKSILVQGNSIRLSFADAASAARALELIRKDNTDFSFRESVVGTESIVVAELSETARKARQDLAIEQNLTTLRNRVDALGVAEPLVQRQGLNRIVVELPGVQDPAQAKRIIGATATLEFRLVDVEHSAYEAQQSGRAPLGTRLYYERDGNPVLLNRDVIITGENLTDASAGFSEGSPAVFVNLDAKGARKMLKTTQENLNKPMAVVFLEQERVSVERGGETVEETRTNEEVISVATIRGVFSSRFQITGLQPQESTDLALLLRAGALAAPIFQVEERTVGPSLGQDNIDQGRLAVIIGFVLVVGFMAVYYRVFGLVADVALLINLVMIVALLSFFQAALTLPGIAGIVLTVGMSVDANVLIFERIREELRMGNTPQASIQAGYEKAFSTIADANITTVIAAIVLWVFGTGPIRGFAVTLTLGILTSMFTAILGTRALVNFIYGRRRIERLAI